MFAASVAVTTNGIAQAAVGGSGSPGQGCGANLLTMTRDTFNPLIGNAFLISTQTSALIPVVLTSVKESPATGAPPLTDAFTLSFRSLPSGNPLPQGTYVFRHAALGSFPLFIVPSGPRAPRSYSAVFNHVQQ
jgi:hypothetical protein